MGLGLDLDYLERSARGEFDLGYTMGHDKFFRYMGTLQAIFDAAGSPAGATAGAGR
jgi:hypothetical protein